MLGGKKCFSSSFILGFSSNRDLELELEKGIDECGDWRCYL